MAIDLARNGLAEVNHILKQDTDEGRVVVHSFDAAASPAEKGAAAGKARDQLKSVIDHTPPVERGEFDVPDMLRNGDTDRHYRGTSAKRRHQCCANNKCARCRCRV